jgi:hypothetical protein
MNSLNSLNCPCGVIYPSPHSLLDTSTPNMGLPVCVMLAGYSLGTGLLYLVCVGKEHCNAVYNLCFSKVSFCASHDTSRFRVNRT